MDADHKAAWENMELFNSIGNLELKVRQLGKKIERLKKRNIELQNDNLVLKEVQENANLKIDVLKDKLIQIQQLIEVLEIREETEQVDFSEKWERILLEINQCLEWLTR